MNWEFGASRCKLLHLEWINNKALLYSTILECVCACVCVHTYDQVIAVQQKLPQCYESTKIKKQCAINLIPIKTAYHY